MRAAELTRLVRFGLGGAVGGLVTFCVLDPSARARELSGAGPVGVGAIADVVSNALLLGAVLATAIGASLVIVEELEARRWGRMAIRALAAVTVGSICGALGGFLAQIAFSCLLLSGVITARTVGWALAGMAAGLCPGVVGGSTRRARLGAMGGAIGGGIGGLLFDVIGLFTATGSLSRGVGFLIIGTVIGLAVALVEELSKTYWLTALNGSREGQRFILWKQETLLGRNEMADIPLFGDPSVARAHARLSVVPNGVQLQPLETAEVRVNGQPVAATALSPGDTLEIGTHRLRFHAQATAPSAPQLPTANLPTSPYAVSSPPELPALPTTLTVVAGPHAGQILPLEREATRIGRSPHCQLALPLDSRVSREHAAISRDRHGWRLDDLHSTNGLFVNGRAVTTHWLRTGDEVLIGDSLIQVQ